MAKFLPFMSCLTLLFSSLQSLPLAQAEPATAGAQAGIEVTFAPTYGYLEGDTWKIHLKGWVHKKRFLDINEFLAGVATLAHRCTKAEQKNFKVRTQNLEDDSEAGEKISIAFVTDPEQKQYDFPESDEQGIIELDVPIRGEQAQVLLQSPQGATGRWLAYQVVSQGAGGRGQVALIESEGLSVISDIDDTLKVTEIPHGKDIVLLNTFCRDFVAAPGMANRYKEWSTRAPAVSFHYVSGGPEQLYGPLAHFLITEQGFPEGTFHMRFLPTDFRAHEAWKDLSNFIVNPLSKIYDYKVKTISTLLNTFPNRQFILVGDSGELDPEVYNTIRTQDDPRHQIQEIWIRDVVGDATVNPDRLEGMKIIRVEEPLCSEDGRFKEMKKNIENLRHLTYARNPTCSD